MHEIAMSATGLLREFAEAGMISIADHHLATSLARHFETPEHVVLAFALAARELRQGSVYVSLRDAAELPPLSEIDDGKDVERIELAWPDAEAWLRDVAASPLVGANRAFVLDDDRLYLARYWTTEKQVREAFMQRKELPTAEAVSEGELPAGTIRDEKQEEAVSAALSHMTSVITGGPGTGKTTTVVRILNALGADTPISVALAAPTGRAAKQLQDSVDGRLDKGAVTELFAGTLHKLLGLRIRATRGKYHRENPLPYDVVVLDETSMVSLEHMAALLDAIAPSTRLILVGDPHQLRSVEAGAVLADIVENPDLTQPGAVVRLGTNRRSNAEINALAEAIDVGDVERALGIIEGADSIDFVDYDGRHPERLAPLADALESQAAAMIAAAQQGDAKAALAALGRHRILCAHRLGPFGVQEWARAARMLIAAQHKNYGGDDPYIGQPLLITRNTEPFSNGDVGVIIELEGELQAAIDQGGASAPVMVSPALLDDAADLHAMTIHKSQGGQYDDVSIVLPPVGSPLATRELLYTAVTRAQSSVKLYGSRDAFAEAVSTPVRRASGLAISS